MSDADMKLTKGMTKAIHFDFIRNLLTSPAISSNLSLYTVKLEKKLILICTKIVSQYTKFLQREK